MGRRLLSCLLGLWLVTVSGSAAASDQAGPSGERIPGEYGKREPGKSLAGFSWTTVGVADLDRALALWQGRFGFSVLAKRRGTDRALASHLGLPPDGVTRQALVGQPGSALGRLLLVEFSQPADGVRKGAATTDLCPKNLDLYARDLPSRYEELRAAGFSFRSPWVEYPYGELTVREVQMPGHDDTNVVILELVGEPLPIPETGYAGLASIITVVAEPDAEESFYREVVGLGLAQAHVLTGEQIEKMVGLPSGAGLDVRLLGEASEHFGRIELVHYQQIASRNLYPLAVAPAVGLLSVSLVVGDLEALVSRAESRGQAVRRVFVPGHLAGFERGAVLTAPSGFRVEVFERP